MAHANRSDRPRLRRWRMRAPKPRSVVEATARLDREPVGAAIEFSVEASAPVRVRVAACAARDHQRPAERLVATGAVWRRRTMALEGSPSRV